MKKLMIAAAAAAMIGGAQAAAGDAVYNFVAVLRTTAAQEGYVTQNTPTTYAFAKDGNGTWWYNDAKLDTIPYADKVTEKDNLYWEWATVGGSALPHLYLKNAAAVSQADLDKLDYFAKNYKVQQIVNGQKVWCCSVTVVTYNPGACYRVIGVDNIADVITSADCCSADLKSSTATVTPKLLQAFGGQTEGTSPYIELYADVKADTLNGRAFEGQIAGQGIRLAYDNKKAFNTISGHIVGTEAAPQCTYCCIDPDDAVAFACIGDTKKTAAYGTFYIAYLGEEQAK